MNCHHCSTEVPPHAKFCPQCGTRLVVAPEAAPDSNGDRRVVTVLFTDVSGFTAMSEKLDPEELTEIVNQFFAVLTEPIYRYGGVVDKYIGDAIMALFGAPVAHEDDPERAVHAAYEMQLAAKEFARDLAARTGINLKVRIGLNTGLVVAGAVGGEQKRDYTVLGDTVNLAQRMESAARPGRVLVTRETFLLTQHAFSFVELDPVEVKGKSQPVCVYEVAGPLERQSDVVRERGVLVSRRHELDVLLRSFQRALQGVPTAVVLEGDAGIGKSHLVFHFIEQLAESRPRVLRFRSQSYTSNGSFGMVGGLVHHWLGTHPATGRQELEQRLLSECEGLFGVDGHRQASLLGMFLGLTPSDSGLDSLSQEQRRNAALQAMTRLVIDLASRTALLLSLEDLQWADRPSLDWLHSLLSELGDRRDPTKLLVLCQQRLEMEAARFEVVGVDVSVLKVQPLDPQECRQVLAHALKCSVADLLPPAPLSAVVEQILDRTSGNPFYLLELLSSLIASRVLVSTAPGVWMLADPEAPLNLPNTIHGAVASRLDRLERDPRSLIQRASVLGRTFSGAMIERLVTDGRQLQATLQQLCRQGYLYLNSEGNYAFTQPLIQEVAYESLLKSSRKELHGSVGRMLEAMYADRLEENAHLLAHHFLLSDSRGMALKYLFMSARRSYDFFDLKRARTLVDRALELQEEPSAPSSPARWELLALLGQILILQGEFDQALGALDEALSLAPDPQSRAEVLRTMGDVQERKGEFQAALECYRSGHDALPDACRVARAPLLAKMGYSELRLGHHEACMRLCTSALELLEGSDRAREQGFANSVMGISSLRRGEHQAAVDYLRAALRYRELGKDYPGLGNSYNSLATIHVERGEWAEADECFRRSLESFERVGDPWHISLLLINRSEFLIKRGQLVEAESNLDKALELKHKIGDQMGVGIALFNLGQLLACKDERREAIARMEEAVSIFEKLDAKEVFPEVYRTIGQVWAELGESERAWHYLTQADALAKEFHDDATLAILPRIRSQLRLAQGDLGAARSDAEESLELVAALGIQLEQGRCFVQLGKVCQAQGDRAASERALAEARRIFGQLGAFELAALPA